MQLTGSVADRLAATLGRLLGPDFPSSLGLAVSGGGDSMAMLHLVAAWARPMGIDLRVATVDHGLRAESASEAKLVAEECAGLGLPHDTLKWDGWDGQGNLMEAARNARLDLLGRWRAETTHILMAHTEDDVAETFLMRLARGSGIEGLGRMAEARRISGGDGAHGWILLRPLLDVSRAELRHYVKTLKVPYVDDPTNDDVTFHRVQIRQAFEVLEPLGLTKTGLAETAERLASDSKVVRSRAAEVAEKLATPGIRTPNGEPARNSLAWLMSGDVQLDRDSFRSVENVTRLRVLSGALQLVASNPVPPRAEAVSDLLERLDGGAKSTLHGCVVAPLEDQIFVFRELEAVRTKVAFVDQGALWDDRWALSGPNIKGLQVRALGWTGKLPLPKPEGLRLPDGLLAGRPSVWDGEAFVAFAPFDAGPAYFTEHRSPLAPGRGTLPELLLSR